MYPPQTAFVTAAPVAAASSFTRPSVCAPRPTRSTTTTPFPASLRMNAGNTPTASTTTPTTVSDAGTDLQAPATWPPPEMTEEWADAVRRLVRSVPGASVDDADGALDAADGDEQQALVILMDENWSDIRRQREAAVEEARANGDVNRVSAIKEAELRRKATGSAQDFFKSFVETEGTYVDAGYVDDSADAMGKMVGAMKSLFGGNKKQ